MSGPITVPGVVYSIILAAGAWVVEYFTGSGFTFAPVILAAVPIILKMFTVAAGGEPPAAAARGMGDGSSTTPRSKMSRFLLG